MGRTTEQLVAFDVVLFHLRIRLSELSEGIVAYHFSFIIESIMQFSSAA